MQPYQTLSQDVQGYLQEYLPISSLGNLARTSQSFRGTAQPAMTKRQKDALAAAQRVCGADVQSLAKGVIPQCQNAILQAIQNMDVDAIQTMCRYELVNPSRPIMVYTTTLYLADYAESIHAIPSLKVLLQCGSPYHPELNNFYLLLANLHDELSENGAQPDIINQINDYIPYLLSINLQQYKKQLAEYPEAMNYFERILAAYDQLGMTNVRSMLQPLFQ